MPEAFQLAAAPHLQVSEEKYSAALVADDHGARIVLRGTISTVNPAQILNPFVDAAHETLRGAGASEVRVDLRELEFCNSSGFKAFVHWIELIRTLPEDRRYRLHFVSSPTRKWQRTSLLALSCYGVDLVTIE
jgi:hypothetical protein